MKAFIREFVPVGALLIVLVAALLAKTTKWPKVEPLQEKHVFTDFAKNDKDTPVVAFIKNTQGVPVYKLECHNGNYDNESEMNFSGDFQCALFSVSHGVLTSGDLLAANTKNELSTDWWNRGRMRSAQLRGECLRYPEYSTDRHFTFRRMLIALRFKNMRWSSQGGTQRQPELTGFTFILKVIPDESAHSSRPGLASGPKPPTSCYP